MRQHRSISFVSTLDPLGGACFLLWIDAVQRWRVAWSVRRSALLFVITLLKNDARLHRGYKQPLQCTHQLLVTMVSTTHLAHDQTNGRELRSSMGGIQ
jgi:hypothetical protein